MKDYYFNWNEIPTGFELDKHDGDVLKCSDIVNRISQSALDILPDLSSEKWDQLEALSCLSESTQNKVALKEEDVTIFDLYLRAQALDKIFNTPPRGSDSNELGPIIAIYTNAAHLAYVNNAYVEAAGITNTQAWHDAILRQPDLSQYQFIKELAAEGRLMKEIYDESVLKMIDSRLIYTKVSKSGYNSVRYRMKNTDKNLEWNTYSLGENGGTIRVAQDVTYFQERPRTDYSQIAVEKHIPFKFEALIISFAKKVGAIVGADSYVENFRKDIVKLHEFGKIGDVVVDKGPFLVTLVDHRKNDGDPFISINEEYIRATGYTLEELKSLKIRNALYPGFEEGFVKGKLEILKKDRYYFALFEMKRKNGDRLVLPYDTSLITDDISIRVGSYMAPFENYIKK